MAKDYGSPYDLSVGNKGFKAFRGSRKRKDTSPYDLSVGDKGFPALIKSHRERLRKIGERMFHQGY